MAQREGDGQLALWPQLLGAGSMASIRVLLTPAAQSCSGPGGSVMRMWTKSEEGGMLVPSLERRWMWR